MISYLRPPPLRTLSYRCGHLQSLAEGISGSKCYLFGVYKILVKAFISEPDWDWGFA